MLLFTTSVVRKYKNEPNDLNKDNLTLTFTHTHTLSYVHRIHINIYVYRQIDIPTSFGGKW